MLFKKPLSEVEFPVIQKLKDARTDHNKQYKAENWSAIS
jgi:hypothetical protein